MGWLRKIVTWFKRTRTAIPISWKGKKYTVQYNGAGWVIICPDGKTLGNIIFSSSENATAYLKCQD